MIQPVAVRMSTYSLNIASGPFDPKATEKWLPRGRIRSLGDNLHNPS